MPEPRRLSRAPLSLLLVSMAACTPTLPKADAESKPTSGQLQPLESPLATEDFTLAAASPGAAGGGRSGNAITPGTPGASRGRMGYWRVNSPDLRGERGQSPLIATNLQLTQSFDGTAMKWIATNGPALLKYRVIEPDGTSNLDCRRGTIRFLYRPNWTSPNAGGKGPGTWIRLFEVGSPSPNASVGWFALSIDPTGTNVWLTAQDNAGHSFSNVCNVGLAHASVGMTLTGS